MFTELPVKAIRVSPDQPRKTINQARIEELAASIRAVGVLEPIMVRPLPPKQANGVTHELVFGERRWRAAPLAMLATIPALVRELTDRQVLEIQIFENDEREAVPPTEQGRAYRRLHDEFGYSIEEIATRSGHTTKWVRERMSLGDLCKEAQQAVDEEKITLGVALLLSRMPPSLQPKALADMIDDSNEELVTLENAKRIIETDHMRSLGRAVFDTNDAKLVAKAGSCTACPKRSGVQAELFADVKDTNTCTDPGCYREKNEAHWVQLRTKTKDTEQQLLSDDQSKKIFQKGYDGSSSLSYSAPFLDANEKTWDGDKQKTWKSKLGKAFKPVLAKAPDGEIYELIPKAIAHKETSTGSTSRADSTYAAIDRRRKLEHERKKRESNAVYAELDVAAAKLSTKAAPKLATVCTVALNALCATQRWKLEQVAKRRGVPLKELEKQFSIGLLLEVALTQLDNDKQRDATCKAFGVNAEAAAGKAAKAFRFEQEAKRAKQKTKAKKTAPTAKVKKKAPSKAK